MNLYMIVTNDRYELPVKCDITVREAAEFLGVTPGHVHRMVCKPPKRTKYKVVIIGKINADPKQYQKQHQQQYRASHDRSEYFREYHKKRKA